MASLMPDTDSKGNKRRPGLKLSFEHLQTPPATSLDVDPSTLQNNTFREQVGNIVSGNHSSRPAAPAENSANPVQLPVRRTYPGCGEDDEDDDGEDSLAAAYLQQQQQASPSQQQQQEEQQQQEQYQSQPSRKNPIPVLRDAPRPPPGPPPVGSVAARYYGNAVGRQQTKQSLSPPQLQLQNLSISPSSTLSSSSSSSSLHHPSQHRNPSALPHLNTTSSSSSSDSSASSSSSTSSSTSEDGHFMDIKPEDLDTIKHLGEGAAGTVRKVLHRPTNLIMAKKTIATDPNPKIQRQILRELSFLKTCQSPHIVSFYGAFLDDGDTTVTLCMEYCEAGSLEDIYKRASELGGVIGEPVLERIAESVCKGLVYLHSQRVIHRDIKPSNILVTRKGEFKLCDFGVSGELINSIAKTFTGTKYYMAPERIQGAPYAVQSDIWSLGLSLIEVSQNTPALPPPGQPHLSIIELLDLIVRQPVPVIQGDHISKECRNFVAVCLIKNPNDRPGPARMLEHPFIKKWEDVPMDLATWVKEVWNW